MVRQGAWWSKGLASGGAALVLICLSYFLPRSLPGDFVIAMDASSHVSLSQEQEVQIRKHYPASEGFGSYIGRLLILDWGKSYALGEPVLSLILRALPWTLLLAGGAHLMGSLLGFVAGVEAAWRRGTKMEKALVGFMGVLEGIPEMAIGVVLLASFAFYLNWLPAGGAQSPYAFLSLEGQVIDIARHLLLPMSALILAYFPGNFLLARNSMIMVLGEEFILTARAKGLPEKRVRYHHAARNALLPVVTRFGLRLGFMVTGVVVVETIFSYPGIGTLLFNAIRTRDVPLVEGIVLFSSLVILGVNLALELFYRRIDPRSRNAH